MEKARTKIIFTISMKSVMYIILYKRIGLVAGDTEIFLYKIDKKVWREVLCGKYV